ncbi:dynein regulatory complex protein 9-like [Belonocnema kinseyi]|uniref:dynein regulatory complex protein 9-like n=1 Tax=Belonocnema kinseyi TaxID=2817044 RepID=UPI00143D4C7F|nr:dynein regulatory complex protein 9-like [Belonocnema kinseyi]
MAADSKQTKIIKNHVKGSIMQPPTHILPEMSTLKQERRVNIKDSVNKEDGEPMLNKTQTSFESSKVRPSISKNIGVLNTVIDAPSSEPLPVLEAVAIASALEECLAVLNIIQNTIPAKVDKHWDGSYKIIEGKYSGPDEEDKIFAKHPTDAEKLQRDRTYIYNVLKETLDDIKNNRRCDRLKDEVENITKSIEDERVLQVENEIWAHTVKQTQDLIASQKVEDEDELRKLKELARSAEIQADNSFFLNRSKLEYVKRWENDRLDQQNLKMALKEKKLVDELNAFARKERIEQIVSEDMQAYVDNNIDYLENKIKKWTNKNHEDIFKMEREIYDIREAIDDRTENLKELNSLYAERQAFIDECYEEEERIRREEEYRKTLNKSALRIQSFWRGYMVRKQLGKYKELWTRLRKRKKLAAIARKKREAWGKKKEKQWGDTKLKTMKNVVDPNN